MESIKFEKTYWVKDFLAQEGEFGKHVDEIIENYRGTLIKEMLSSKDLEYLNTKPQIYALRIRLLGICFRFLGPKIGNTIYLVFPLKKQTNKLRPPDLRLALRRSKIYLEQLK